MPDLLIGYTFDQRVHAYRNLATGRLVARARILELLDAQLTQRGNRLARLTLDFASNQMAASQWLTVMKDELRRAHLENAALGRGGWDRLTAVDFGRIGYALRSDYRRLVAFAEQIRLGEVSEAQALNRLNMYLGQARLQYWRAAADRRPTRPDMVLLERRVLGIAEHCVSCVMYSRAGWRPAGVLPRPGQPGSSECDGNCRCHIEVREVSISEATSLIGSGEIPEWTGGEVALFNPYHEPAGSPIGGRFARKSDGDSTDQSRLDSLHQGEVEALWLWTGDNHFEDVLSDQGGYLTPFLKSGLQKMPDYHGELVRWQNEGKRLKAGDEIVLPALASFARPGSSLEQTRGRYEPVKWVIRQGSGKRLLFSYRPNEREVVVARGTRLRVIDVRNIEMPEYVPGANRWQRVITLEQLNNIEFGELTTDFFNPYHEPAGSPIGGRFAASGAQVNTRQRLLDIDITSPSQASFDDFISQGVPDGAYVVRIGGVTYDALVESWWPDCLESRGYGETSVAAIADQYLDIMVTEAGWPQADIYNYLPLAEGSEYGLAYIGKRKTAPAEFSDVRD